MRYTDTSCIDKIIKKGVPWYKRVVDGMLKCCLLDEVHSKARRRLGKKISYVALYENGLILDKHESEIADLKFQASEHLFHQKL